jgi:exodeoxyribonuclease VII small subunit
MAPKAPIPPAPATLDFEAALAELQAIVEKMESGDQTLEEALASFQRGVELTRTCQQGLKEAEQRVEKLVREGGELKVQPLTHNDNERTD